MKKYKKEILHEGTWKHASAPGGVLRITKEYLEQIVKNFKKTPFAPLLRSHVANSEAEKNPELVVSKNISGLEVQNGKLYAEFEMAEEEIDRYNDVSASIIPDYQDKETGEIIGPVLQHVALVLNPYIKGMEGFLPLSEENRNYLINLSDITEMSKDKDLKKVEVELEEAPVAEPEEIKPEEEKKEVSEVTTEEIKETEKVEEVVETPEEVAPTAEETAEESKDSVETEKDSTEDGKTSEDLAEELKKAKIELAEANRKNAQMEAENAYSVLLSAGKILPCMKEEFIQLTGGLSGAIELSEEINLADTLMKLFEKFPVMVNLEEQGVTPEDEKLSDEEIIKAQLRELPVHANKSAEEFDKWFESNKKSALEAFKKLDVTKK